MRKIITILIVIVLAMSQPGYALRPIAEECGKRVYDFGGDHTDGSIDMKDILGNKGANLAEMTNLGLPVPAGFTIPYEEVEDIIENHEINQALWPHIESGLVRIEEKASRQEGKKLKYGSSDNFMLLAVRAGAVKSKPGEYRTINKVGLHRSNIDAYAQILGDRYQAYLEYIRYIYDYISCVDNHRESDSIFKILTNNKIYYSDLNCAACKGLKKRINFEKLQEVLLKVEEEYKKMTKHDFSDPKQQLKEAITAVANSYTKNRGKYTFIYTDTDELTGGINVQWQVFGNINDGKSLSGVLCTRSPFTGEPGIVGNYEFAVDGSSIVTPYAELGDGARGVRREIEKQYKDLENSHPEIYKQLLNYIKILEAHQKSIQHVEIVVSAGKLWIVQTRDALDTTTPLAQARTLVDLAEEGILNESEAFEKISLADLEWLKSYFEQPVVKKESQGKAIAWGASLFPGIATAEVSIGDDRNELLLKGCIPVIPNPFEGIGAKKNEGMDLLPDHICLMLLINEAESSGRDVTAHIAEAMIGPYQERILKYNIPGIISLRGGLFDHVAEGIRKSNKRIPYVVLYGEIPEKGILSIQDNDKKEIARLNAGEAITLDGNTGYIYKDLTADDFEDSEITKVLHGDITSEDSKLYKYYLKTLEWIDLKEQADKLPQKLVDTLQKIKFKKQYEIDTKASFLNVLEQIKEKKSLQALDQAA
ncbi:MAG: PEP/pyruvate-binding domain-containing protein [Candidatus Omnitrophota bacterium]